MRGGASPRSPHTSGMYPLKEYRPWRVLSANTPPGARTGPERVQPDTRVTPDGAVRRQDPPLAVLLQRVQATRGIYSGNAKL